MKRKLQLFLLLVIAYTISGQCPKTLINYVGQPVDVTQAMGIWYEYYHMDYPFVPYDPANDPGSYNLYMNGTILFANPKSGYSSDCSYAVTWMYNGLWPTDPLTCIAIWQAGNYSTDGRRHVMVQFDTRPPDNQILDFTYVNLYTDYKLVQVLYRCNTPNADRVYCDEPFIWVITRIQPPLLTVEQKRYIQTVADQYIAPVICGKFKFADMSPTKWDLTKIGPPCNVANNQPPMSPEFQSVLPKAS